MMTENNFCSKCGSNQLDNLYCTKCGHKLTNQESVNKSIISKEPVSESKYDESEIQNTIKNSKNNILLVPYNWLMKNINILNNTKAGSDDWWKKNFFSINGCLTNIFMLFILIIIFSIPSALGIPIYVEVIATIVILLFLFINTNSQK